MLWDYLQKQLDLDGAQGLRREIPIMAAAAGRTLCHEGREYLNFAANNYLGLADHPEIRRAWQQGLEDYGVGAGSARLINGSAQPLHDLERALAQYKGAEAALLFNSGYQANVGVLPSLLPADGIFFSDELNHASLIDGLRLSRARREIYPHGDVAWLKDRVSELRKGGLTGPILVVTETVFSMDGDVAPLGDLLDLAAAQDLSIYIDEAHATGVFGPTGAGVAESYRDHPAMERVVQMGTLGKALGCLGAYVAGPKVLIDYLIHRARTFIFTTGLPPALGPAVLKALELARDSEGPRAILWQRLASFAELLGQHFPERKLTVESPIVPWMVGEATAATRLSDRLKAEGYWVSAIRPPTVPEGKSRLRISLMAEHSESDLAGLVLALKKCQE